MSRVQSATVVMLMAMPGSRLIGPSHVRTVLTMYSARNAHSHARLCAHLRSLK